MEPQFHRDERGFFGKLWSLEHLTSRGLVSGFSQCGISFNRRQGTIRGMHMQKHPQEEVKLVCCTAGAIWDVALDLRSDSASYRKSFSIELSSANRTMLYIPKGVAHGFQTLRDNTEVLYHIAGEYAPECEFGVRWDDSAFSIQWPLPMTVVSVKDRSYPDYQC